MDMRVRNVDRQLHYYFRLLCAAEEKSQSQKIQELMREAVKKAGLIDE